MTFEDQAIQALEIQIERLRSELASLWYSVSVESLGYIVTLDRRVDELETALAEMRMHAA